MIEGWEETEFSEILVEGKISYGIVQPGPDVETDFVPILRVQDIKDGRINSSDPKLVSREIEAKYAKTRLRGGELLITVVGSVGECAVAPTELAGFNVARAVSVANIKPDFDTQFVRYAFSTPDVVFQMYGNTNDTVQATLNLKELKALRILHPDLGGQRAIAEVLSSLDDKIDLLHRQNATLEALAETLFRQYFIEEAQDDWEEEPLDQVADYLNGLACQKYPAKNPVERLPVLKIKDLKNGLSDSSDWATSKVPAEYIVENGDIIFSWSASLLVKLWDGSTCVLNQHLFKVTSERFPDWFIYRWTKHHLERFIAIAETKATTMGHIKRTDLAEAMVKIPDEATLEEMESTFVPIHGKIVTNNRQIAILREKRDTLLPKLMSGAVRVQFERPDAEAEAA